jgi:hypothetical protein
MAYGECIVRVAWIVGDADGLSADAGEAVWMDSGGHGGTQRGGGGGGGDQ